MAFVEGKLPGDAGGRPVRPGGAAGRPPEHVPDAAGQRHGRAARRVFEDVLQAVVRHRHAAFGVVGDPQERLAVHAEGAGEPALLIVRVRPDVAGQVPGANKTSRRVVGVLDGAVVAVRGRADPAVRAALDPEHGSIRVADLAQ